MYLICRINILGWRFSLTTYSYIQIQILQIHLSVVYTMNRHQNLAFNDLLRSTCYKYNFATYLMHAIFLNGKAANIRCPFLNYIFMLPRVYWVGSSKPFCVFLKNLKFGLFKVLLITYLTNKAKIFFVGQQLVCF